MARGTGADFTFKDLMLIGCLFFILPTICLCVVIVTPIIGTILFLTRDPDEEGRVTFFYISWALGTTPPPSLRFSGQKGTRAGQLESKSSLPSMISRIEK